MEHVTRDVITDLWPVYVSGEASPDTRTLVELFLGQDPEFAQMLREGDKETYSRQAVPALTPDHELKTLARLKRRLAGRPWLLMFALIFTGTAFGRIVSDTSFDVSPRKFIVAAVVAACFWVAFLVSLFWGRRTVLIRFHR